MATRSSSSRDFAYVGKALIAVYAVFAAFPLYWTLNTALKPIANINTRPPTFYPEGFTLDSIAWVLTSQRGGGAIFDSIVVASGATAVSVILGIAAGYGFSRFPERVGGKHVAFWLLSTRMFPPIAVVLPIFFIWGAIGLRDSYIGMILLYLTFNLPLTTWLMRDFFNKVPISYEEAAYVDGYSRFSTFRKAILPTVTQGIVATTLLAWVFAWNEFLFAFVLSGNSVTPYTTIVNTLGRGNSVLWNRMMAVAFIVTIPPSFILIFFRNHIISGMSLGVADME